MKKLILALFVLTFFISFNFTRAQESREQATVTTEQRNGSEEVESTKGNFFQRAYRALVEVFVPQEESRVQEEKATTTTETKDFSVPGVIIRTETATNTPTKTSETVTVITNFSGNCQNKQTELLTIVERSNLSSFRKVSARRWVRLWYLQCLRGQAIDPSVYLKSIQFQEAPRSATGTAR